MSVAQEHLARIWARECSGTLTALRYHNVYGPGMPADTPYAGVAAIFRSAIARGEAPKVFEDGAQMRPGMRRFSSRGLVGKHSRRPSRNPLLSSGAISP